MLNPIQRRTSPDECEPGDYIHEDDHPDWRDGGDEKAYQPGHEPGAADPFSDTTYKMKVPDDWVFEPRLVHDAGGTHRVWTRVR